MLELERRSILEHTETYVSVYCYIAFRLPRSRTHVGPIHGHGSIVQKLTVGPLLEQLLGAQTC